MAGALSGGAARGWRRASDFVDRVYGEFISYQVPLEYDQTRGLVSDSRGVDIYMEGMGFLEEDLEGAEAVDSLDRLTLEGENVENVDFRYRYGVFSDRFEASIRIAQEGETYTLEIEGRR